MWPKTQPYEWKDISNLYDSNPLQIIKIRLTGWIGTEYKQVYIIHYGGNHWALF